MAGLTLINATGKRTKLLRGTGATTVVKGKGRLSIRKQHDKKE